FRLLEESGLGLPDYYRWRSRSGCYFCFFQQKIEWVGLLENHPSLFQEAMEYEKQSTEDGHRDTWVDGESLAQLAEPRRVAAIKEEHARRIQHERDRAGKKTLVEVLADEVECSGEMACLICDL
ncbi:MAG: phosphoadenosine phosphosulfate reductase family protein, partial [Candidatus Zipacnadales bacterium]